MRILFTRFPLESALGGAERQTLSLTKGLSERGHAVAFLGSCPVLLEETAKLHLPHAKLEIGPPPVTKWAATNFLWRKRKMQQRLEEALEQFCHPELAKDNNADVDGSQAHHDIGLDAIFMLSLSEKLLLTETAVKKGIRVFWIEHDRVGPWLRKNPWLTALRRLSVKVTTICVSELSRKIYLDLGWDPGKVIAIPNGIDLERFSPSPFPSEVRDGGGGRGEGVHFGCVARLSLEKGVDVLIQAASGLPNVDLTIIGKGPQGPSLRSLIQDRRRIQILHHTDDLPAFYHSIDVLVLSSRDNDPFGLVAAEAMACGTPVIVTDQCGIAGYLTQGTDALIVEANSQQALRGAVLQMTDASLRSRLAAGGEKTARKKFAVSSMVDAYDSLLRGRAD